MEGCGQPIKMAGGLRQLIEKWCGFNASLFGSGMDTCLAVVMLSRIYAATATACACSTFGCSPEAKMLATESITERKERARYAQQSAPPNRP